MARHAMDSIRDILLSGQVAIDNTLDDPEDILAALIPYGYDETRMRAGKAIYEKALSLHQIQQREYGEQYDATGKFNSLWSQSNLEYMDGVKIARIALRDQKGKLQALGLDGIRKKSLSGWMEQATQFYSNALADNDVITAMSRFGFDQPKLQAGQQLVQQVADANAAQEKEKGEAREATRTRDIAIDELAQWIADFKVVAKIALQENPKWLEKLGFN